MFFYLSDHLTSQLINSFVLDGDLLLSLPHQAQLILGIFQGISVEVPLFLERDEFPLLLGHLILVIVLHLLEHLNFLPF